MNFIEDLLSCTVGCSCGLCCSKNYPCEKCLENTLNSNEIDLKFIDKFRGLKNRANGYTDPWGFSELFFALKEHKKNAPQNNKERGQTNPQQR